MNPKTYLLASICMLLFGVMIGFVLFPKFLKSSIKSVSGNSFFCSMPKKISFSWKFTNWSKMLIFSQWISELEWRTCTWQRIPKCDLSTRKRRFFWTFSCTFSMSPIKTTSSKEVSKTACNPTQIFAAIFHNPLIGHTLPSNVLSFSKEKPKLQEVGPYFFESVQKNLIFSFFTSFFFFEINKLKCFFTLRLAENGKRNLT